MKDSLFDSNSASYRGGAIDFDDSISREGRFTDAVARGTNLDANLVNVNFTSNNAQVGGAVELCNGILSATGVKFTGNSACVQGGALDIRGVDYDSSFNILDADGKHFSDFFTDNSAPLGKSVLIYRDQYLNHGFICDEGVNSGEILKDYYSTWK
ncbi:MAG: Ig-like domain repeat protein partial [Methanobrevibacter sp. CfCl-M3]